jgi:hypothetical protein
MSHRPERKRGIPIIQSLVAMTWIDQQQHEKTINAVLTRTGIDLTAQERQALFSRPDHDTLLRPREVAEMFGVRPSTIARWAREGRLIPLFTPGGHRRYRLAHIRTLVILKNHTTLRTRGGPPDRSRA